jgi:spermidine synthase
MKLSRLVCTSLALVLVSAAGAPHLAAAPQPRASQSAAASPCGTENLLSRKTPSQQQDMEGDIAVVTDDTAVPEGALWDGPSGVRFGTRGSMTFDLGAPRKVSAFYLQADANDVYRISGSLDGTPGSFKPLTDAANVVDRGPGMRARTMQIPGATVRYLRVGEGEGDSYFSISEFAAYCQAPAPFPPNLRVIDAPMAVGKPAPAAEKPVSLPKREENPVGPFELTIAAALVLLVAARYLARGGRRRGARTATPAAAEGPGDEVDAAGGEAGAGAAAAATAAGAGAAEPDAAADADDGGPEEDEPEPPPEPAKPERFFPFVVLLFLGSGCAALIYEIVWFQMLQLVIGSNAVSIGVLLGTFMAGMCIGSLAFARYVSRRQHPLRVYAFLELGIGALGLLMLVLMPLVQGVYTTIVGHGVPGLLLRGLFAAICLLPPTVMMGATLPAVSRWVETTQRGVSWLALFYGANTFGAVSGCLVAGFFLLRLHDMPIATYAAVGLNVLVALGAIAIARAAPQVRPEPRPDAPLPDAPRLGDAPPVVTTTAGTVPPAIAWVVYITIALSGMCALAAEVVWTRLFTLLLGGTTYTFSIILAVFLVGIGIGSGVASPIARRTANPLRALGIAQLLLILAIAWTAWNITEELPYWPVNPTIAPSPWRLFQIDFVRCLWAILPPACLWGASFPLALASVASEGQDGGKMVGRVYAANTVGAIIGALGASLVVVGWLGTQAGERIIIALAAVSAVVALVVGPMLRTAAGASPSEPASGSGSAPERRRLRLTSGGVIWLLAIVELASFMARNAGPVPPLLVGHGRTSAVAYHDHESFIFVGEGMNSSLAVSRDKNGIMSYHNAGKTQASTQPQDMRLQRMLGHLTTLVPADPQSVLVIGCGAGVTAGAASIDPRVKKLTIAEIEPLVPTVVAKYFGDYNFHVVTNPKTHVHVDDARHFLNTTKEKFDAITSDPFDPWVKGAANLYTKEFWAMAKSHLKPGGVVTVFVQLYQSGTAAVKSEIATFFEVFPDGMVFGNTIRGEGYDVVLLGQAEPFKINVDNMDALLTSPDFTEVTKSLRQIGVNSAVALLSTLGSRGPDLQPWLKDAQINRDKNLRLQFLAGLYMDRNERVDIYKNIVMFRRYPEDLFVGSPERLVQLRAAMSGRPP